MTTDHRWLRHVYERLETPASSFCSASADLHYPPELHFEPEHTDIVIEVRVDERVAAVSVTHRLVAIRDEAREIELDGVDLDILEVEGAQSWRYDGEKLFARSEGALARGETLDLRVVYSVCAPATGLFFSAPDESHPDRPRWVATDHETERARHWLLCVDHPSVRPTLKWTITADESFTILANGSLESESVTDGRKTSVWSLEERCPSYLTCFVAGELIRHDDGEFEGRPLAYFGVAPHEPADLLRSFDRTKDMLQWMQRKLDLEFPYPKYFQFALPGFGGAMENISLVSWDDIFVLDETFASEWKRLVDQINVHEMAHAYFGDLVVCRDFAHVWLKESWATYIESCWFEDDAGTDEQHYELWMCAKAYFREANTRYRRPIVTRKFDSSWDMYDQHLYPGGAVRLHALRLLVGDEAFWTGVRAYLERHAGKVVETDDFRHALETSSGRPLARFFDQWFRSPGHPCLKVGFEWDEAGKRGTFDITQTQVDKKSGVGLFDMEFDLSWTDAEGHEERRRVQMDRAHHVFGFDMEGEPAFVRVDPEMRVVAELEFKPGAPKLKAQLVDAPDVVGRILAGQGLAATGKSADAQAVLDAWPNEPFWGVRAQWAAALAESASTRAIEGLASLIETEQHPGVLDAMLHACADLDHAALATAAAKRFSADELGYRAKSAALRVMGRRRKAADTAAITEAAGVKGFAGIVQAGAAAAMAATRAESAAEVLRGLTDEDHHLRVREAATRALGGLIPRLAKHLREPLVERLAALVDDGHPRVESAAVTALVAAEAGGAVGRVEAYRARAPAQERARVDRLLTKLRKADSAALAAAERQIDELRKLVRDLGERVDKMEAKLAPNEETNEGDAEDDA